MKNRAYIFILSALVILSACHKGDSLSSDIRGGINAGIKTCWVNPNHLPCPEHIKPDYEIEYLHQLEALLESL